MDYIDLRSDTVTWPTPAMREAMANAEVGDDVFGDDPTVNRLQEEAAAMFGKEAGLFVASGTMGNLVAALTHCARGEEMIVGKQTHMFMMEAGSGSAYGGIQPFALDILPDGTMDLKAMRKAIRGDNPHYPVSRLICLENASTGGHGAPLTREYTAQVAAIAHDHNMKLHIDGARIFHAATALKIGVRELTADADSVMFCLSKGLCAPVGSMLVGSKAFIRQALRVRKSLGGGMRQVGVLAAAGLVALREMTTRLEEDHVNARLMAEGLAAIPCVNIDVSRVKTNMFFFTLKDDAPMSVEELSARLKAEYRILLRAVDVEERRFRVLTHYWIKRSHVEQVVEAMQTLLTSEANRARLASD